MSNIKSTRRFNIIPPVFLTTCLVCAALLGTMPTAFAADLININRADAATISSAIDGIGPVKAQAIVTYREQNGEFANLDDLQSVPGIGKVMFDRIKASLSLNDNALEPDATAQLGDSTQ